MHVEIYKQSFSSTEILISLSIKPCQQISNIQPSTAALALAQLYKPPSSSWPLCGGNIQEASQDLVYAVKS